MYILLEDYLCMSVGTGAGARPDSHKRKSTPGLPLWGKRNSVWVVLRKIGPECTFLPVTEISSAEGAAGCAD